MSNTTTRAILSFPFTVVVPEFPEDERGWDAYVQDRGYALARFLVVLGAAASLLAWPFDLVLHPDRPELVRTLAWARGVCSLEAVIYLLAITYSARLRRHAMFGGVLLTLVLGVTVAYFLSRVGWDGVPLLSGLHLLPLVTVALLVPLRTRLVVATVVSVVMFSAWFFTRMPGLPAEFGRGQLAMFIIVDLIAVSVGHALYNLLRLSYLQRLPIERKTRELHELTTHLEQRVREKTHELRELATHLETVRESERALLAREIHDELAQVHMAMRIEVDLASRHLPPGVARLSEHISYLQRLLDDLDARTRMLVSLLRPQILDDLGLVAATEWLVEQTRRRGDLSVSLDVSPTEILASTPVATALFRVLQESLTNVSRHANAHKVAVTLSREGDRITLEVRDDGKGIPEPELRRPGAMGIVGMRERIRAMGGTFTVTQAPGGGTVLTAWVPDLHAGQETT